MGAPHNEALPQGWHTLSPEDAHFLGRLSAAGIAMPNTSGLFVPSLEVPDITTPEMQAEVDRLITAADAIAAMPGTSFAGLAHAQLAPTKAAPRPYAMFLAPAEVPGLPSEIKIGNRAFRLFVNTSLKLPSAPNDTVQFKEGCFSSGPVSVVSNRPNTIKCLRTTSRDGEPVTAEDVGGFEAVVVQHEYDHTRGVRAADIAATRNWVTREELPKYRGIKPAEASSWPHPCTQEQWEGLSRDPDYPLFLTKQLREAFEAGVEAQQRASGR